MKVFRRALAATAGRLEQNTKASLLGLLDASVCLSYLLAIPVPIWYAAILFGKALLIVRYGASKSGFLQIAPFITLISISLIYTEYLEGGYFDEAFNVAGFILSLAISASLLRRTDIQPYLYFMALLGTTTAALYLILALFNLIPDHYGRLMFFNGSHPNLGGESFAMFLIATIVSFRGLLFWLAWALLTAGIFMMQARAALLVAIAVLGLYLWRKFKSAGRYKPMLAMLIFAGSAALILSSSDIILTSTENIFLMSDESRGVGTGFVGREDRWNQALNIFYENPFLGGGFAAFDKTGMLTPHNYFLAGISNMGMIAIFMFIYLGYCIWRVKSTDNHILIAFAPLLILMIINDRFINMNPYPFTAYVVIFALSARTRKRVSHHD